MLERRGEGRRGYLAGEKLTLRQGREREREKEREGVRERETEREGGREVRTSDR